MVYQNLNQLFEERFQGEKDRPCLRHVENGQWQTLTWWQVRERVVRIAGGLNKLGVQRGDRVCIFSRTRYEWTLADLGILGAGGIVVPIYESNTPEQAEYILNNCEAKVVFVEGEAVWAKIRAVQKNLTQLRQIVLFTDPGRGKLPEGVYTLDDLSLLGAENGGSVYQDSLRQIRLKDDISFVYTSGTTGNPKGAILTHGNFISEIESIEKTLKFEKHYEHLLFLPLAHIFARILQYGQLGYGFIQCYAESIDNLMDNIAEIRPHFLASVPRIYEKIYSKTMQSVQSASPTKKKIFDWAVRVGSERAQLRLLDKSVPLTLEIQYQMVYRLVFKKLHNKLGGRLVYFLTGGAPLSREIALFFEAAGFTILEGYGLTETTAAATATTFGVRMLGSVGRAVPGVELKIAADGEILVRGGQIFRGYYKDPESTREAFNSDGWFHTGDIGVVDEKGFLTITDRKKDLIITAGGKNVAPQNIENLIKSDPLISQAVVHGDRRKFMSAIITLDRPEIEKYAQDKKIQFKTFEELVTNESVHALIKSRIDEKNKKLASYESIKKFAILPADFSVETGELTPTMKVKRKVINEKYKNIFDGFYHE